MRAVGVDGDVTDYRDGLTARGLPYVVGINAPCRRVAQETRRACEAPLACRTRLPGDEARDRARPLRRTRLARIPSPRGAMRRRPRIPRAPQSAFPPKGRRRGICRKSAGNSSRCCCGGSALARCAAAASTPRTRRGGRRECDRVVLGPPPRPPFPGAPRLRRRELRFPEQNTEGGGIREA